MSFVSQLAYENDDLKREIERLRRAVLNQCGDNLCHLSDEEVAEARASGRIPPWPEFQESCHRFHSQVAEHCGVLHGSMTIAQLEAEVERLRAALVDLIDASRDPRCADLRVVIERASVALEPLPTRAPAPRNLSEPAPPAEQEP